MKKKGRICGAIGLILSLALAGGTIVYGMLFDKNAVGKAEKPFGDTTGNVFDGWINKSGFDETKKLVDESGAVFDGTAGDAAYRSYSLSFTESSTLTLKAEGKTKVENILTEGNIYTDKNYTYVKVSTRRMAERTAAASASEYVFNKAAAVWYSRTNVSALTENSGDAALLDKAKWEKASPLIDFSAWFEKTSEIFQSVSTANSVYIDMTGEYYFKNTAAYVSEGTESECRFTVGLCPTIRCTYTQPEKDADGVHTVLTSALSYSNLNNTVVSLPKSLEEAMK